MGSGDLDMSQPRAAVGAGHQVAIDYTQTEGVMMARYRYGILNFVSDAFLTLFTGGLWIIWIFVREMRNR